LLPAQFLELLARAFQVRVDRQRLLERRHGFIYAILARADHAEAR
jgi:hypothetical protein